VRGLVVVCPTGIQRLANRPGPAAEGIYRVLRGPVGRALFAALTSRSGVRLFLRGQAYHSTAALTPPTVEGFYRTCRAPGAHYAPVCFLTGLLNCAVRDAFASLAVPTLIVWGAQATTTPVSDAQAFLAANPRARLEVVENASLLVQDERPAAFNAIVRGFAEAL
jgi:pimeloyl-ACP methyl ester carboxylesterase